MSNLSITWNTLGSGKSLHAFVGSAHEGGLSLCGRAWGPGKGEGDRCRTCTRTAVARGYLPEYDENDRSSVLAHGGTWHTSTGYTDTTESERETRITPKGSEGTRYVITHTTHADIVHAIKGNVPVPRRKVWIPSAMFRERGILIRAEQISVSRPVVKVEPGLYREFDRVGDARTYALYQGAGFSVQWGQDAPVSLWKGWATVWTIRGKNGAQERHSVTSRSRVVTAALRRSILDFRGSRMIYATPLSHEHNVSHGSIK